MSREWPITPILPDQKVYAVRAAGGCVKIGTTKDLAKRLEALQCGQPSKLELVAVGPGGREVEQRLHQKFAHRRVRGEWFMLSDNEIVGLRGFLGGSISTTYLPKVRRGGRTRRRQSFNGGSFRLDR